MRKNLIFIYIAVSFYDWLTAPAKWWEFWRPQAGFFGGLLAAVIISVGVLIGSWILIWTRY